MWADTVVTPVTAEVRSIGARPGAARGGAGVGAPAKLPGPESMLKLICVPAGALAEPVPSLTLTWAVKVWVSPTVVRAVGCDLDVGVDDRSGSQAPVDGRYVRVTLVVGQEGPSARRVTGKAKAVASNCAVGVERPDGPELRRRRPVQVPLRNQSMLTLPVGIGLACLAGDRHEVMDGRAGRDGGDRLVGRVVDGRGRRRASAWIRLSEAAPTFGGFGLQFELPVAAGSLHRSCQPSDASSRSWWPGRREVGRRDGVVAEPQDVDAGCRPAACSW